MATELVMQREPDMMSLLQLAISKESAIDVIERLATMQKEAREYRAKVDFNDAMQRVQEKMKRIGADALNPQTKSRYATYGKLDSVLRPIYSSEGFSLSFDTADCPHPEMIRLRCYVSNGGFTVSYQIDMPADGKGAKGGDVMTKTHATGAAASYGMRYLLKMIFNVAVGEDDDDGNLSSLPDDERNELIDSVKNSATQEDLNKVYLAGQAKAMNAKDMTLVGLLTVAAQERRKALKGAKDAVS